jgi:hypothetical protein
LTQAERLAAAGVLVGGDLPGWAARVQTAGPSDDRDRAAFLHCAGAARPHYVHRNHGTAFTKGMGEIDSSADVVSSAAEASAQAMSLGTQRAAKCYEAELRSIAGVPGVKLTKLTATLVPVAIQGAEHSFVYHVVAYLRGAQGTASVDIYALNAAVGATELTLTGTRTNSPASLEEVTRLATIVASRVRGT